MPPKPRSRMNNINNIGINNSNGTATNNNNNNNNNIPVPQIMVTAVEPMFLFRHHQHHFHQHHHHHHHSFHLLHHETPTANIINQQEQRQHEQQPPSNNANGDDDAGAGGVANSGHVPPSANFLHADECSTLQLKSPVSGRLKISGTVEHLVAFDMSKDDLYSITRALSRNVGNDGSSITFLDFFFEKQIVDVEALLTLLPLCPNLTNLQIAINSNSDIGSLVSGLHDMNVGVKLLKNLRSIQILHNLGSSISFEVDANEAIWNILKIVPLSNSESLHANGSSKCNDDDDEDSYQ